jgi:ribosomal protein S18 acetylase RimI-like enzyme
MSTTTLRRASIDDIAAIVALLADDPIGQSREDPSVPINPRYLAAFVAIDADPNQLLAVAEVDGTIAGCLQLTFIPGITRTGMWRGHIEGVRIATHRRGTGLGRTMFDWAIEQCRTRDCGLVQLTTDKSRPDALRFYESLGFIATHEGMKLVL